MSEPRGLAAALAGEAHPFPQESEPIKQATSHHLPFAANGHPLPQEAEPVKPATIGGADVPHPFPQENEPVKAATPHLLPFGQATIHRDAVAGGGGMEEAAGGGHGESGLSDKAAASAALAPGDDPSSPRDYVVVSDVTQVRDKDFQTFAEGATHFTGDAPGFGGVEPTS